MSSRSGDYFELAQCDIKTNDAICTLECTSRSSLSQLMSRDEAKIAAMMIPCQWHHTFKYLLKQILRFVFNAYSSRTLSLTSCVRLEETCKILWLTSRTLTIVMRIELAWVQYAKCSVEINLTVRELNFELTMRSRDKLYGIIDLNCASWKIMACLILFASYSVQRCIKLAKMSLNTTRGFFDINNSS